MEQYPLLSIVSPVYKAEKIIPELYNRICKSVESITQNFEIVLVNDGSPDRSWEEIKKVAALDKRVKGIYLSRNFGQHNAITAGLDHVKGDWVVVMDCDLQDQPEEIPKMYQKAQEGYDVVLGRRANRKDSISKKFFSRMYNHFYSFFTDTKADSTIANFGVYHNKVIQGFYGMREHNRSFPLFVHWMGFSKTTVDIEHAARYEGKSSYSLKKLIRFASNSIIAFSNKPLYLSIAIGFFLCFVSFSFGIYYFLRYFINRTPVAGWTSIMVSLWFIAGMIMANLGIIGIYIGKIFDEVKKRPIYLVQEKLNFDL